MPRACDPTSCGTLSSRAAAPKAPRCERWAEAQAVPRGRPPIAPRGLARPRRGGRKVAALPPAPSRSLQRGQSSGPAERRGPGRGWGAPPFAARSRVPPAGAAGRLAGCWLPRVQQAGGSRQAAAGTELPALSRPAGAAGAGPRRRHGPECECEMLPPAAAPRAQVAAAPAWMRLWSRRFVLHKHFYRTHSPC